MAGRLTVVGTPIGNLGDMSPRAERALREADTICCEDTRRTRALLSAIGCPAPRLLRLDRHNERQMVSAVVSALEGGGRVALVSDAGMPTISDPGADLVRGVAAAGLQVEVVPGPSAVGAALAVSGLPASRYHFAGFLPRKGRERASTIAELATSSVTSVIYEAANRVARTVADLAAACGPERAFVAARELTKLHEGVWRGDLGSAPAWLATVAGELRGEWVLLLGPASAAVVAPDDAALCAALGQEMAAGADRRSAVATVADRFGVPKRRVYGLSVEMTRTPDR